MPVGSKYVAGEAIGRGATGTVYRGARVADDQPVAIKILDHSKLSDPEIVTRFVREREALTGLRHPSIVSILDLVIEGDTLAIVSELVRGGDLRQLLRIAPSLPPAIACRQTAALCQALSVAHARGVIHRDIKPENILVDTESPEDPRFRLTDFGIARLTHGTSLTRMTSLIGTPDYMAPELAEREHASPQSDLYAIGVLLYELVAGRRPFGTGHPVAILRRHLDEIPARPPEMPDPVWRIVEQLLAKAPGDRPEDAAEVAAWLNDLAPRLDGLPASATAASVAAAARAAVPAPVAEAIPVEPPAPAPAPVASPEPPQRAPSPTPAAAPVLPVVAAVGAADAATDETGVGEPATHTIIGELRKPRQPVTAPPAPPPDRRKMVLIGIGAAAAVALVAALVVAIPRSGGSHRVAASPVAAVSSSPAPSASATPAQLQALRAAPAALPLQVGDSADVAVAGVMSDGTVAPWSIIKTLHWTVSNAKVLRLHGARITALRKGSAVVTIRGGAASASVVVSVAPKAAGHKAVVIAAPNIAPPLYVPPKSSSTTQHTTTSTRHSTSSHQTTSGSTPKPTAKSTPRPATVPTGTTETVDNGSGFSTSGPWSPQSGGYGGAYYTTQTKPSGCSGALSATATWTHSLPASGKWTVQVYLPATSYRVDATYYVLTSAGTKAVTIPQQSSGGWVTLGTAAMSSGRVQLDNTNDQSSDCNSRAPLNADAVRWVYAG